MKLPIPISSDLSVALKAVFGITLSDQVCAYRQLCERLLANHGEAYTVQYLKGLYTQAVTYVTAVQIHEIPFRKTTKEGLVKDLKPFTRFLKGSPDEIRAVLTILRQYTLFYQEPKPNLESITSPGGTRLMDFVIKHSFRSFIAKVPKEDIRGSIKVIPRARSGPNGSSSLMTSHLDAVGLTQRPELLDALHRLAEIIHPGYNLKEWIQQIVSWVQSNDIPIDRNYHVGRLVSLAEGGHKTRTIAIGDLFSQAILLPLHKSLMQRLRNIKVDGTWNQQKSVSLVKEMTLEGPIYSFDLTNATDRFPAFLQEDVLASIYGAEVASLWRLIMKDLRDFSHKDSHGKEITGIYYKRGQGMGLYSSWPAFALTHHYLVRYCADLVGIPHFERYTIIGDDVVIGNTKVARCYEDILNYLEVPISKSKSILSEKPPYSAEICKRIIVEAKDLSPVPADLIVGLMKDFRLIPTFLDEIHNRYNKYIRYPTWSSLLSIADLYKGPARKKALILLTAPTFYMRIGVQPLYVNIDVPSCPSESRSKPPPSEEGYWPWDQIDPEVITDLEMVHEQVRKVHLMREYETVFRDWSDILQNPPTVKASHDHVTVTPDSQHPFWRARDHVMEVLTPIAELRFQILGREDETSLEDLGIRFAMDPTLRSYRERKKSKSIATSHLTLDAFKVLAGEKSYPVIKHPKDGILVTWLSCHP